MGNERVSIFGFNHLCGIIKGLLYVSFVLQRPLRRLLGKFSGSLGELRAALVRPRTEIPFHAQLLARQFSLPPGIGDDSDSGLQTWVARIYGFDLHLSFDDKRVPDAGHLLNVVEVRVNGFPTKYRTLFKYGKQHAWKGEIDGIDRFAGNNIGNVDP